ncbi:MAG: hypothetical protein KGL02_11120, partial [Acidobacteriota bacterium]|nr:hypothetical protein [Acidobacteriota bacterium]
MIGGHSIRQKLTRIVLTTCGASILLACAVLAAYDVMASRKELAQELAQIGQTMAPNTTAGVSFGDSRAVREVLGSLKAQPNVARACVYKSDGSVLASYVRAGEAESGSKCPPPGADGIQMRFGRITVFEPISLNAERIGTIYAESDLGRLYARARRSSEIVLMVVVGSFLAAYVLASRLQREISEPILDLARVAFARSINKDYRLHATK